MLRDLYVSTTVYDTVLYYIMLYYDYIISFCTLLYWGGASPKQLQEGAAKEFQVQVLLGPEMAELAKDFPLAEVLSVEEVAWLLTLRTKSAAANSLHSTAILTRMDIGFYVIIV